MGAAELNFTVFTKSWPEMSLEALAKFVAGMGFDGVELPVRPGYQVTPEGVAKGLPEAAKVLADHGLKIGSVAGPTDEATIAAMGAAGVRILRVCEQVDMRAGYLATEAALRAKYDALVPALDAHGVTLGIQNHCDHFIGSAIGMVRLIEPYDPRHVAAVLDPAHCGLDGEPEDMAIDIAWPRLALVNLKNAFRRRQADPQAGRAVWQTVWTTGREGFTSWPAVAAELKKRGYQGDFCLCAEYSDADCRGQLMGQAVNAPIADDLAYAREVFAAV